MMEACRPIEVALKCQATGIERQCEVCGKLTGKVKHASPATIHPVNLDSQRLQRLVVGPDMNTAARSADADGGWMLAQDQGGPALFTELIDDATLKLLDLEKVDQPQHVNFERRQVRRWPHCRSTGGQYRVRYQTPSLSTAFEHPITVHVRNPLQQVRAHQSTPPSNARGFWRQAGRQT